MAWQNLVIMAALAGGCLLAGRLLIHYFQLESYQHPGYFRTVRRNLLRSLLPGCIETLAWLGSLVLFAIVIPAEADWLSTAGVGICVLACGWAVHRTLHAKNAKKPLKFTPRIKRLYATAFIVFFAILQLFRAIGNLPGGNTTGLVMIILFPLFLPLWIALAGLIAWPVEKLISELYFRDAQRILKERKDLIRIGITGSWGKTSVKFILGTILGEKYNTLVTPASFNTPMGVTRVIRTSLEPSHRVFIAEMGARHVGDIREMCRLVHPVYGILTSVGPQHLDTFRTVERVTRTKYELMEAVPADGKCFFADDNGICRELYRMTDKEKYLAGTDSGADDVWAEDVSSGPEGSIFTLCAGNTRIPCRTQLLGELNIRNIVLCASVALSLGMSAEEISRGISRLHPVEHRLEIIRNPGGFTIIDDAFNSNIRGAEQAFRVLKEFPGKRIVITPGMVELGDMEYGLNREFGTLMAGGCDIAILVGRKRSEAIAEGLKAGGFPEDSIHVTGSLDEAASYMRSVIQPGDTVLFENDLPDNYSE